MASLAFINNEILTWARKRTLGPIDDATKKLKVTREKLEAWEKGESYPTYIQAIDLAKKLKIPFGYFYLSEPPDESLPLPDLRVKPGTLSQKPSPDFLDVLYDAMRKQEWYHDYLINEGADSLPFVGRYTITSEIDIIANDIRIALGLDDKLRNQAIDNSAFFSKIVKQAETAGVLVLRNSVVGNNTHRSLDPNEFQGFAMSDKYAPMVFVNQNDYLSARIFTLMHELAHIWMGISGVSIQDYLKRPIIENDLIQTRANQIAAETLVPRKDFISRWENYDDVNIGLEELAKHYKVSIFVILRRALEIDVIPYDFFNNKYEELKSKIRPKGKSGGNGLSTLFSRNSHTFTVSILNSVAEGKTLPTQASSLLNVSLKTLYNLQTYLGESKINA
jgi:Zn-dependent peptidase ImmA (M78 family)/DNA-binding XRE family transcriptional regulator